MALTYEQLKIKCEVLAAENADLRDALLNHEIMNAHPTPHHDPKKAAAAEVINNGGK